MTQKTSPWIEGKYGWNLGESGWNSGMDENLVKFSYLFDKNVDGVVATLPPEVEGAAYFNTTDNRLYFVVGGVYYSTPCPKWMTFNIKSTGALYKFNGTSPVQVQTLEELEARLGSVELTLTTLGSAAYKDESFFVSQTDFSSEILSLNNEIDNINTNSYRLFTQWDILGDGSDETAKIQTALSELAGSGCTLLAEPGKTYKFSNVMTLDSVVLDFQGSTVQLLHVGQADCFVLQGDNVGIKNATISHLGTVGGGLSGITQYPILSYGCKNFIIENLIFTSPSLANRVPIALYGAVEEGIIRNIRFDGDSSWGQGIICHWLCQDGTTNASATNLTLHPKNIVISNIRNTGNFTNAGLLVSLVFLSGAYSVVVENIFANITPRLISVFAGDYNNDFAGAVDQPFINSGISIVNPQCYNATLNAINISGHGALSTSYLDTSVSVINPRIRSSNSSGTSKGIITNDVKSVRILGGRVWGFQYNIHAAAGTFGLIVDGVEITEGSERGIYVSGQNDGGTRFNQNIHIKNCWIHNNNTVNLSNSNNDGVLLAATNGGFVTNCTFGQLATSEKQYASVWVAADSTNIHLDSNHTYSCRNTVAYVGDTGATAYTMLLWAKNNTSDTTNTLGGHVWYENIGYNKKRFMLDASSGFPTTGTWVVGDELVYRTPLTNGYIGAKCTSSGTPGVWQNYGEINLSASATYDPPSLTDGSGVTTTVTITGAVLGDFAVASFSNSIQGITVTANVTASNTVSVRFQNETGGTIDLASGTLYVKVMKP